MIPGSTCCERHECRDTQSQAHGLASAIAGTLSEALARRGHAMLAVSGGRSPLALFKALRAQALDWRLVTVLLVDERVVPLGHPDSNARLVREHLLQEGAAHANFCPPFDVLPEGFTSRQGALEALCIHANERLSALPWPLDVAVLGMGEDGHTASLFAGAQGLAGALQAGNPDSSALGRDDAASGSATSDPTTSGPSTPMAWIWPPAAPHARLTLTLPVLRQARCLMLAIQGAAKREVLERACLARHPQLPISWLLHDAPRPLQVWLAP